MPGACCVSTTFSLRTDCTTPRMPLCKRADTQPSAVPIFNGLQYNLYPRLSMDADSADAVCRRGADGLTRASAGTAPLGHLAVFSKAGSAAAVAAVAGRMASLLQSADAEAAGAPDGLASASGATAAADG